jgi:uncharacterized membrane protein
VTGRQEDKMLFTPRNSEINNHTIKLIVGLIAVFLGNVTSFLSHNSIESISASYYVGGLTRDIFVGSLCAISAFLLAYNGRSKYEMLLSKVAAIAALGIALFPCKCGNHAEIIPRMHGISSFIMFLILAAFCYAFLQRARKKGHWQAVWREVIYGACGLVIVASIAAVVGDYFLKGAIAAKVPRLTFYCERAGLSAFGIAWLTASRVFPVITSRAERFAPWSDRMPSQ